MQSSDFPPDSFGDRFCVDTLPLPRAACGYAVQMLDTDKLLDQLSGTFLDMRDTGSRAIFSSFSMQLSLQPRTGLAPMASPQTLIPLPSSRLPVTHSSSDTS